jgi:hypothetical protein
MEGATAHAGSEEGAGEGPGEAAISGGEGVEGGGGVETSIEDDSGVSESGEKDANRTVSTTTAPKPLATSQQVPPPTPVMAALAAVAPVPTAPLPHLPPAAMMMSNMLQTMKPAVLGYIPLSQYRIISIGRRSHSIGTASHSTSY